MNCSSARNELLCHASEKASDNLSDETMKHLEKCRECSEWLSESIAKPFPAIAEIELIKPPPFVELSPDRNTSWLSDYIYLLKMFFNAGLVTCLIYLAVTGVSNDIPAEKNQRFQYSFLTESGAYNNELFTEDLVSQLPDRSDEKDYCFVSVDDVETDNSEELSSSNTSFIEKTEWSFLDGEPSKYSFLEEEKT
ncbi:MAG: hypothetical protein HQM10_10385 [Candidatus Riflebacteria bacterium]|nr:hypothetical protein [Candidatus Riflebacteria bacterium]